MQKLTLLERIDYLEKNRPNRPEQMTLEKSLMRHLTDLLNTRKGSVPIAPDYGIADITDLGRSFSKETINEFTCALENVVLRYEPRLSAIHILYNADTVAPLSASFKIEATLAKELGQQKIQFETTLDSTGSVRLTREDA